MTRNTKIVVGILAGLLVLCVCTAIVAVVVGGWLFNSVATSPERAEAIVTQVGAPELAMPGLGEYQPEWSVDVLGVQAVSYAAGSQHVIVARIPDAWHVNMDAIQSRMRKAVQDRDGYTWWNNQLQLVGKETVQIGGQAVDLLIAEGNGSGGPYRQVSGLFTGAQGRIFFSISGKISTWDQGVVDEVVRALQ